MLLDNVTGQDAAVGALRAALASGRIPNAFLFAGPWGVGKALSAFGLAKALLCRKGPRSACDKCPACHRVDSRTHADLFVVEPADGGTAIGIEEIRRLCESVAQTPLEGVRKVAVVDGADAVTEQAQNAFLKTLEEPPADTTIILVSQNTDALLPTVRSRCRRVNFTRISDESVRDFIVARGVDAQKAGVLARLADGSFGGALALVEGDVLDIRGEFVGAVFDARPGDEAVIAELLAPSPQAKGRKASSQRRQDAKALLVILHSVLVDCLRSKSGAPVRTNVDLADRIERFVRAEDVETLARLEKEVSDAIIVLGYYAEARLVAMRLGEAFARRGGRTQVEVSQ